jgi:3-oxoacyl-[acyl-carrier-protein] synthase-3
MATSVGIRGLGLYLPPTVRSNAWWPDDVVARWKRSRPMPPSSAAAASSPGAALVAAAVAEQSADPFQGSVARHVMDDGMTVLDMAERAARSALMRCAVSPDEIDLLLTHTVVPDVLLGNAACQLHRRLGLPRRCFAMETDASTYSFMMQLTLAEAMIASGRANLALLVQSCGASRHLDMAATISPLFGDGATAAIVGPVSAGRGIRAAVHRIDSRYPDTLAATMRCDAAWDRPRAMLDVGDAEQMGTVFLLSADLWKETVDAALSSADLVANDLDFFAIHQGAAWMRELVQRYVGLERARSIDIFPRTAYLFAASVPASMALAEQAGLLREDDLVMATSGGTGVTFGSMIIRWGA